MERYPPLLPGVWYSSFPIIAACLEVRAGCLDSLSRPASRSMWVASGCQGTNFETKIFNFRWCFGPFDRNELYQPHYYPKYEVWAIEFFCARILFRLHMDPMCKNGMSWALTCRRILSWILPRRDNTSPCRKHKLTWMENTTGKIKRLIVYRELLPFLPIWPELRYGIHFDIYFVKFLTNFEDLPMI